MGKDWFQDIECGVLLGITPGRRGILYHRLFSSQAPGFVSEPAEVQQALKTVSQALARFKKTITWITDRGFDDVAAWRTIWEQGEHVVCRIYHTERLVEVVGPDGQWIQANLAQAQEQVRKIARVETTSGACNEASKRIPSGSQSKWRLLSARFA
jgi:hypothetical protein